MQNLNRPEEYEKTSSSNEIVGFVSHRCKDYHDAPLRGYVEDYLLQRKITPKYGCKLDNEYKGIILNNIKNAIGNSDIYIAVITKSWKNRGWPEKECGMWKQFNKDDPKKMGRCFGLLIDIERDQVPFINGLMCYRLSSDINLVKNLHYTKIFEGNPTSYYIRKTDCSEMNDLIERLVNEVKKTRRRFAFE